MGKSTRFICSLILTTSGVLSVIVLVTVTTAPAQAQPTNASWTFTGNLNQHRWGHTATLLLNGKVLVAGGIGGSDNYNILSSAELYDPTTGRWSYTGGLRTSRYLCTATLLSDGRVLITGGYTHTDPPNFGVTNTAELYDPGSGTWSPTGNLTGPRAWHTATLLRSGKVLVAGGATNDITSIAELWDPVTGIWTATGSLTTARYGHTATLLQDGNVLIAGGSDDGDLWTTLDSVELYDPVAGTWTSIDSLTTGRVLDRATLLPSGKVLASGGYTRGYNSPPTSLNSAELYDPATRNWSYTGSLNRARNSHTTTLLPSGQVLVAGGDDWNRRVNLTSAELYDLSTASFTITADLNTARLDHSATLLPSGKVLVAGGFNNISGILDSVELYDPGALPVSNPIDDAQFFVLQHYADFLNRQPDAGGLAYWTDQITQCGSNSRCVHERRIGVSAAFFIEAEFQDTGYYVYRIYKASFGRQPNDAEFTSDRSRVIGGSSMEANKQAFADEWVQRAAFVAAYPITMSNTEVVNKLFDSAGLTSSIYDAQRQQEISAMNAGRSRALVLRDVIEVPDFKTIPDATNRSNSQYNSAFVLMQYFGYLRRNQDQGGYAFWLDMVNNREPNNYRAMVCAFITSREYQLRFGSAVTRSNADCGQ
jgi:N-acetylneuraminic acid mutarotase